MDPGDLDPAVPDVPVDVVGEERVGRGGRRQAQHQSSGQDGGVPAALATEGQPASMTASSAACPASIRPGRAAGPGAADRDDDRRADGGQGGKGGTHRAASLA